MSPFARSSVCSWFVVGSCFSDVSHTNRVLHALLDFRPGASNSARLCVDVPSQSELLLLSLRHPSVEPCHVVVVVIIVVVVVVFRSTSQSMGAVTQKKKSREQNW